MEHETHYLQRTKTVQGVLYLFDTLEMLTFVVVAREEKYVLQVCMYPYQIVDKCVPQY